MGKETNLKPVGQRLAQQRKKKKMSYEELSEKTGLKVEHLNNIESGKDFAPVGDILKISRALTIDPNILLKQGNDIQKEQKKKRVKDFEKRAESYNYTVLTPDSKSKHLRAFRVTIPTGLEHPKVSYQHEGEELVYVLKGEVEITVGQKKNHLKKDETFHFNSGIKHSLKNPGETEAILIVIIYSP